MPIKKYADGTSVPVEKSQMEVQRVLKKHGATKFVSSWDEQSAVLMFVCKDRMIRFSIPLPTPENSGLSPAGYRRSQSQIQIYVDAETRRLWRATLMCIKAKLEAVESHIETFDEAFLSHIVTDDKRTVYERLFIDKKSPFKMLDSKEEDQK